MPCKIKNTIYFLYEYYDKIIENNHGLKIYNILQVK